ncbi:tetratricopeptide repeat protein [Deinococcus cellulosilyticus]|uniref:Uncharacterized protein n=1 Tax=Deinococcus cellulosilyticus (strain DSM 18568 / NBRC 106333 / KACC 11606 / 5516J-15) TaxID=1223518 RepID=A0A511N8R6_DEIC1|nr:tetratricopeptide repeat protein [Deinococcus cellulosilyticus]GEM49224.1 hypothetical protein DC3_48590 [Deinococcus cellulosilyticus NBRC 106333 = KACC 11606]
MKKWLIASALLFGQGFAQQNLAELQTEYQNALKTAPKTTGNSTWKSLMDRVEELKNQSPTPEVLQLRANIYSDVKWWIRAKTAWEDYQKVSALSADQKQRYSEALHNLAFTAAHRSEPDLQEALQYAQKAIEVTPDYYPARYLLAETYQDLGDYNNAKNAWKQVLELNPKDSKAQYFVNVEDRLAKYGKDLNQAFTRGYAAYAENQKGEALNLFKKTTELAPDFSEGWRYFARTAFELGDAKAAMEGYQKLTEIEGQTPENTFWLNYATEASQFGMDAVKAYRSGYTAYQNKNFKDAENLFKQATSLSPSYQKAWAWLGRVRYEQKNYSGAVQAYMQAVTLDPDDESSEYYLKLAKNRK